MVRAAIALLATSASATLYLFAMSNTEPIVKPLKSTISVIDPPAVTPFVDIASAGPLTHVYLGNELSCQVAHAGDTAFEFFPPATIPGDSGTFIAMGGILYAPDFVAHGGTATGALGARVVFTPVSQSGVTGTGTAVDPFTVVTVVDVSTTGLQIEQTDRYIIGDEFYRTDVLITNNGGPANGVLYRAADAFLAGSDLGYGFTEVFGGNRNAVGCSINPNNIPPARIEEWIPLTGGNNFYQDRYSTVWSFIGTKAPFPDTCACTTFQDNGAGISWNFSIPAGGSATYSHFTNFSPLGRQPLVTSKTADSPTSMVGSQNGYTITIENPNPNPVTLTSITDTLPAGFNYVLGSSTGVTTSDPIVSGQMLTWTGSFVVAASSSVSLHFAVVANIVGDYLNEAGGQASGGFTVTGTGPTALITVTACGTPTPTPCPGTVFGESFDGVTAPALPAGWVATNVAGPAPLWVTSTTNPDSEFNAAFVAAPATISDKRLDTPGIAVTSTSTLVSFRNNLDLQDGFDGGVLEISSPNINGGAFTDILDATVGGSFITGGYNATISSNTGSPIAGRMAWSGFSCGYFCTVADLGPNVSGQTIRLRFRMATDSSVAAPGWRFDTLQVLLSGSVCGPCVVPTLAPAKLLNISTRALVGTGSNVLIGGFIITGSVPKSVVVRGIGPSLTASGIPNPLADPILELRDSSANLLMSNDNWRDDPAQAAQLQAAGLAPTNDLESGMVVTLPSCSSYTAIVAGKNGGTGVGVVEVFDINPAAGSELANLSSRAFVQTGGDVMIGGFILGGNSNPTRVVLHGIGPSLPPSISPLLDNPTLELFGGVPIMNDDWLSNSTTAIELILRGLPLQNSSESGIFVSLAPGAYTAILAGQNNTTGNALFEIYNVH